MRGHYTIWPLFFVLSFTSSCSLAKYFKKKVVINNSDIPGISKKDYIEHLESLGSVYLRTPGVRTLRIRKREKRYLDGIVKKIANNNELLLPTANAIKFHIIKEKAPFVFSLPGYQFFISDGLIKKYLKNESILVSALAYEIIKSGRNLYFKNMVVPTGHLTTPEITSLVRINHKDRVELYKWTFIALKRSGYDATAILNWIQTINKNSVDFTWQLGNSRGIANDEFQFKSFLAEQGLEITSEKLANSSKSFYRLRDTL